ncbi:flavodoxin domain-containing protein [Streptomyces sp. NPDC053431]|uniref:flavodoxin domain-containing protein n=1 Tax=Streptomyces sp. NPDC053431 TaxID=3365703 RepID=UPI0037D3F04C
MVSVRVLYASEHRSTQEIADRIGERLRRRRHPVETRELRAPSEGQGPLPGDALVLGSAVHDGAWLPTAEGFVADTLRLRPSRCASGRGSAPPLSRGPSAR